MAAPVLQFKRGSAGAAGTVPALRPGEPALSLNNFDFFIGFDTSVSGNKFLGSHRYWRREDGTSSLRLSLVDKDGTNNIQIKSPDTLVGVTTYTLPETPVNTFLLATNATGNLSWTNSLPASTVLPGITSFTDTTDNTLGNPDTGSVQIDGGLGINKNVSIGGSFYVGGTSEFVGVVTFRGGTINIGDSNTDNINVGGEFVSNLVPNDDNSYDIGISTQRWRNSYFSGKIVPSVGYGVTDGYGIVWPSDPGGGSGDVAFIQYYVENGENARLHIGIRNDDGTNAAGPDDLYLESSLTTITGNMVVNGSSTMGQATIDNIQIGVTDNNTIDTNTGPLTLDSGNGNTIINDDLTVTGNLFINGSTTQVNTAALTIEDRTIELGRVDGNAPSSATTWDLGVLFNYYDGSAKKSAVVWESADAGKSNISIFKFATVLAADTDGTTVGTPQLSVTTYAPIEIGALWVNNTCTGGAQEVIGCIGAELNLQNITIDAGTF